MAKNKKIVKYAIIIFSIVVCLCIILTNRTFAINTDNFKPNPTSSASGTTSIFSIAGYALGVVQIIGMAVATIMLLVLGIKYMTSSPNDKATLKEKAVIYVTGAIIIFAASGLVGLIGDWASSTVQ